MGHGGPRSIAQCHSDQLECQNWHVLVVRVPGHGISENKAGQVRECWEVPLAVAREVRLKTVGVVVPGASEGGCQGGRTASIWHGLVVRVPDPGVGESKAARDHECWVVPLVAG